MDEHGEDDVMGHSIQLHLGIKRTNGVLELTAQPTVRELDESLIQRCVAKKGSQQKLIGRWSPLVT